MENSTIGSTAKRKQDIYILRTLLFTDADEMFELLLPNASDGFYHFSDATEYQFVSIFARNGKWFASCKRPAFFKNAPMAEDEVPLCAGQLLNIEFDDREYSLYIDGATPEEMQFRHYSVASNTNIHVGSKKNNEICCSSDSFPDRAAMLRRESTRWFLQADYCGAEVYVNGEKRKNCVLKLGDRICILGLQIIIGPQMLSINHADTVQVDSRILQSIATTVGGYAYEYSQGTGGMEASFFNRLPRKKIEVPNRTITIEGPPMSMERAQMPLMLRMGSSMVMGGMSALAGNFTTMLTSVLFPLLSSKYTDKQRQEYEHLRLTKYTEYLEAKRQEIQKACADEKNLLELKYPHMNDMLRLGIDQQRLWERRPMDSDFLHVRLGTGRQPIHTVIDCPERRFELEPDELEEEMYKLAEKTYCIDDAPVVLALTDSNICSVLGKQRDVRSLIWRMVLQLSVLHSYDEVKILLLLPEEELAQLDRMQYLPHMWDDQRTIRFVATNEPEAYTLGEYIQNQLEIHKEGQGLHQILKKQPYYVAIVFEKKLLEAHEIWKTILQSDDNLGVSIITAFEDMPKETQVIITVAQNGDNVYTTMAENGEQDIRFVPDTCDQPKANTVLRMLANTKLKTVTQVQSMPIVNCDDVRYVQHDDGIGWDIFIKMELLTPLTKSLSDKITEGLVVKLAKDLCTALELCKKLGIIHRDIKPQNIFVSPNGDYKLGDFGIAKTVETTMGGTKIGTYKYMAPEVYNNQPYGSAADIYSLGLVLYWLLNERRMPFLPLPPEKLKAGMDDAARQRRLSGEKLPPPTNGSKRLKEIVLKACAYDPKDRYSSATEMKAELEYFVGVPKTTAILAAVKPEAGVEGDDKTVSLYDTETLAEKTPAASSNDDDDKTVSIFSVTTTGGRVEEVTPAEKSLPLDEESRYILPQIAVPQKGNVESVETEWECSCGNRNEINVPYCSACFKSKPVKRGHVPNADERKAQNTGHKKNGKIRIVAICILAVFIVSLVAPLLFAGPGRGDYSSSQPSTHAQSETIHGHVHSYEAIVVPPTCTERGYTVNACSCGNSYQNHYTDAFGHNYEAAIVPPTESDQGYTVHTCTQCGHSYKDTYIDKLPENHLHSYTVTVVSRTCTEKGYTYYRCQCGVSYYDYEIAALGHNYDAVVTPSAGTVPGYATYTCTRCGDTYQLGISHSDITLNVGDSFTLTLMDQNGKIQNVAWEASEAGCVAISGNRITAIAPTNPYIKIFATYRGITYYCIVRCMAETPGQTLDYVQTPVIGRSYKLGLYNTSEGSTYYFTGYMNRFYGATTTDASLAVPVTVESAGPDQYYLSFVVDGNKKYFGTEVNGTHLNVLFVDESARATFTWNAQYSVMVTVLSNGVEAYMGTFGEYTEFGMQALEIINDSYPVRLYY